MKEANTTGHDGSAESSLSAQSPASESPASESSVPPTTSAKGLWLDVLLLTLVFFVTAGWPAPDVNEAHYLAKAKRFWDPSWCQGDLFLDSADAHGVFYWTWGWATRLMPLPAVAWVGRLLSWLFLAWAWTRLSRVLASGWLWAVLSGTLLAALVHRFHMAGEWLVGGIEAKSFAFAFVFIGLRECLRGRWQAAGPWMGVATAFHVLIGGWSWVALALAWLLVGRAETSWKRLLLFWPLGLLVALLGVVPALWLGRGATALEQSIANQIYVFERLSHHLVFHRFQPWFILRHGVLVSAWVWGAILLRRDERLRRLNGFVAGAVLIAVCGVVIDTVFRSQPHNAAALLRFYWFRLSDVAAPIGVALMTVFAIRQACERQKPIAQILLCLFVLLAAGHVVGAQVQGRRDMLPASVRQPLQRPSMTNKQRQDWHQEWLECCQWVRRNTPANARFLTPRAQQTFKWYAHRGEVANWKDVPQDARAIIDWRQRMREIYTPLTRRYGLTGHLAPGLIALGRKYEADYVIVDSSIYRRRLKLQQVFPDRFTAPTRFVIYKLPTREAAPPTDKRSDP